MNQALADTYNKTAFLFVMEALNNYLRCQGGVKKWLKMLFYYM